MGNKSSVDQLEKAHSVSHTNSKHKTSLESINDTNDMVESKISTTSDDTNCTNGISPEYIPTNIAEIAADFWRQNISSLSNKDQLEIACAIGYTSIAENAHIKSLYFQLYRDKKVEQLSLKLFH
eukprot:411306_1